VGDERNVFVKLGLKIRGIYGEFEKKVVSLQFVKARKA
jgi:hypothetical protein